VYGIIKQSGGAIDVVTQVGEGTTFSIVLPLADELVSGGGFGPTDEPFPRGTETILLVEDEEDVRTLARRTLREVGYTVIAAADAEHAVTLLATARVDVLLTDIVMPHLSGPQLVKQAQTLDSPPPVVIYMSGYADEALTLFELDPSVTFLRKPFTPMVLARTVREALDGSAEVARAARR
jgi:CheY-like chemotaxis protein